MDSINWTSKRGWYSQFVSLLDISSAAEAVLTARPISPGVAQILLRPMDMRVANGGVVVEFDFTQWDVVSGVIRSSIDQTALSSVRIPSNRGDDIPFWIQMQENVVVVGQVCWPHNRLSDRGTFRQS
jgi:hypothetical protein